MEDYTARHGLPAGKPRPGLLDAKQCRSIPPETASWCDSGSIRRSLDWFANRKDDPHAGINAVLRAYIERRKADGQATCLSSRGRSPDSVDDKRLGRLHETARCLYRSQFLASRRSCRAARNDADRPRARVAVASENAPTDYSKWSQHALEAELAKRAIIERKVLMPMRDGVNLSTDIYRPKDATGPVPTDLHSHALQHEHAHRRLAASGRRGDRSRLCDHLPERARPLFLGRRVRNPRSIRAPMAMTR